MPTGSSSGDGGECVPARSGGTHLRLTEWPRLVAFAHVAGARTAAHFGWDASSGEDLAQHALLRLCVEIRARRAPARPKTWLRRVIRRLALDHARGRRTEVGSTRARTGLDELSGPISGSAQSPVHLAAVAELREQAAEVLTQLPPPQQQIATLKFLHGCTRREITTVLQLWRPVGESEVRRQIRRTTRMLRALGEQQDMRALWPIACDPKRNSWSATPPPPDPRLKV